MSSDCRACTEYMELSRRQFLGVGGAGALALTMPEWLPRVAYAQDACTDRDIIVCVFLRGAMDGLTACCPHADDLYYAARPTLAIPRPDSSDPNRATDLDGYFGFPPPLVPLIPAYQAGHLLLVHACGSTSGSRSHFDAMRFMEIAKPGDNTLFTGWLGRHIATSPPLAPNPVLRAIGIGYGLQQSLQGGNLSLPVPDLDNFELSGDDYTRAARMNTIISMYNATTDPLKTSALSTQQTINFLNAIDFAGYQPGGNATYPNTNFGYSLKSTAALIRADVGVEAVAIDIPGWDTHNYQGVLPGGALWDLLTTLGDGLAAFHADMFSGNGKNVIVMVMSEFGRRLLENGSFGTDHGHGNCMFIMGKHVNGGRVLTQWPGLAEDQLFQGRDLAVTIDFRDLMAEVVFNRLKNPNLATVFPGYTPTFRGVTLGCPGDLNCDSVVDGS
ncbi:MAG TPA: DUF1501 domain-containing protein, partial [Phycisphaerae bacterium]|nr:DUF1501 domain-containing protein [Phycisphaerae bacterium]